MILGEFPSSTESYKSPLVNNGWPVFLSSIFFGEDEYLENEDVAINNDFKIFIIIFHIKTLIE